MWPPTHEEKWLHQQKSSNHEPWFTLHTYQSKHSKRNTNCISSEQLHHPRAPKALTTGRLDFLALSFTPQEPHGAYVALHIYTHTHTHLEASLQMFLQMSLAATSCCSGYAPTKMLLLSHFTDSATLPLRGQGAPAWTTVTASVDQTRSCRHFPSSVCVLDSIKARLHKPPSATCVLCQASNIITHYQLRGHVPPAPNMVITEDFGHTANK